MATKKTKAKTEAPAKPVPYVLTDEHRALLPVVRDQWIKNALRTGRMTPDEKTQLVEAIHGLYDAADLPRPLAVVVVPSPFILRFAGGFAAAWWWLQEHGKAPKDACPSPDNTINTQEGAAWSQTVRAVDGATNDYGAVAETSRDIRGNDALGGFDGWGAGSSVLEPSPISVTPETPWYKAPVAAYRKVAEDLFGAEAPFALQCAVLAYRMWQGGNQWSGWCAPLSFFRDVAKLPIDWSKYAPYEAAAKLGGPRIMHAKFCMVSELPVHLTVDAESRPHNDTGPFCQWADGTALYAFHGTRVPAQVIEAPASQTVEQILGESNAEVRRVRIERFGWDRFLKACTKTQADDYGTLYEYRFTDEPQPLQLVQVTNGSPEPDGTYREFVLPVVARLEDGTTLPPVTSAREAVARSYRIPKAEAYAPEIRT